MLSHVSEMGPIDLSGGFTFIRDLELDVDQLSGSTDSLDTPIHEPLRAVFIVHLCVTLILSCEGD